jgi:glyoxylate carboligase
MPDPIDVPAVAKDILKAMKSALKVSSAKALHFAATEARHLAQMLADIATGTAAGVINAQEAKALLQIQRLATQSVLLTVKGLGIIAVDNALNAGLAAVKAKVNKAAGIPLL